ncbi:MAG: DUF4154 domain-containing protein [Acidobacteria bacterium]|nr:DUF4154 domain-containing protein [Acidobacteriota bacterium]
MRSLGLLLPCLICLTLPVRAQEETSPDIQAITFTKIFSYVKTLKGKSPGVIAIVDGGDGAGGARAIAEAFRREIDRSGLSRRFRVSQLPVDRLDPASTDVCYIGSVSGARGVESFCLRNKVLTITSSPEVMKRGMVSILVGLSDNKLKIVVNMSRLRSEGHEISAELLDLPRVAIIR